MKRSLQYFKTATLAVIFLLMGTLVYSQCPPNMISYWDFDETGGLVYTDQVGGHNALAENAPTDVSGIIGNGKYFDGTKRVSVNTHPDYNFANNQGFSIGLWAKFSDVSFGTFTKVLMGKNEPYATVGGKWWISAQLNTGLTGFYCEDANGNGYEVSAQAVNDNQWHYIVAVRNPDDNSIKLYIDGTEANSAFAAYTGDFSSTAPIQMGYLNRNSIPNYWYKGALDDIAIYDEALTASEILENWTKGSLGIGYCDGYSPTFKSSPVLTGAVGEQYVYNAKASGMPPITYSLDESPSGMSINSSTGQITWTPGSVLDDGYVKVRASNPTYPPDVTQEFSISIADAPDCPPGLARLWRLDETAGPIYKDYYGEQDIIADISPVPTPGIVNGAQTFDNTTTMNLKHDSFWEWPKDVSFTWEMWVKTTNSANNDALVFVGRLRNDEWFTNWWVGMDANEYPVFYLRDSWNTNGATPELQVITGNQSLANGVWHHVVAVRDGSARKNKLYVDGVKVGENNINYQHSFTTDQNDSIPVNVGWFNSGAGHRFTGQMDELGFFNRALSDSEIIANYANRMPEGHCAPGNYAPVINSQPETNATQDAAYSYTFETDDFDLTDVLFLTAPVKPSWLTFSHTLGQRFATLTGTPDNSNVGDTIVTLQVSDGSINKQQTFTLSVADVNDPPAFTSTPIITVEEDEAYSYTVSAEDPDVGDVLTYEVTLKPDWLTWDEGTLTLSGNPTNDEVGTHNITIEVSDGVETIPQSFVLTVNNVNMVPVITGQIPLSVANNNILTLLVTYFTVDDNDNDFPGDFSLIVHPGANYTVVGTTVTPTPGYIGSLIVAVQVNDGQATSALYNATVDVVSGNVAPQITGQLPLSVANNMTLTLTLNDFTVLDPDNTYPDDFSLLVSAGSNYTVSGTIVTPADGYEGNINVGVQVNDGIESSAVYYALVEVKGPDAVEGIDEQQMISVYPNPATEVVFFKVDPRMVTKTLEVYSSIGNLVKQIPIEAELVEMNATELDQGTYIYRIVTDNETVIGNFTVLR